MKKAGNRILSTVLAAVLLVTALNSQLFFTDAADSANAHIVDNYPLLKGYTGTERPSQSGWNFGIKDFGTKPDFQESDSAFKAPQIKWNTNDSVAEFSWDAISGATSYKLIVFSGTNIILENTTGNLYFKTITNELNAGESYEAQIIALGSDNSVLKASCIRRFTCAETSETYNKKIDFAYENKDQILSNQIFAEGSNRFSNITVTEKNELSLTGSKSESFAYLFSDFDLQAKEADAIVMKVRSPQMVCAFSLNFAADTSKDITGTSGKIYKSNTYYIDNSGTSSDFKWVSVSNPHNVITNTLKSKAEAEYSSTAFGDWENGYYLIIPLSCYSSQIKQDILAGDLKKVKTVIQRIRYKKTDGTYGSQNVNFDGTPFYIDEIGLLTDTNSFVSDLQSKYDSEYIFEKNDGVYSADKFTASSGTLVNEKVETGYTFKNTNNERFVTFNAITSFSKKVGPCLTFTAPKKALYDFGSELYIKNNNSVLDGNILYHIIKQSNDGSSEVLYPFESDRDFATMNINTDNKNPVADLKAPMAQLEAGEKIIFEAYLDTEKTASVDLCLGYPVATVVKQEENYKSVDTIWEFGNYVPHFSYDGGMNDKSNHTLMGRWFTKEIDMTGDNEKNNTPVYNDFSGYGSYSMEYTNRNGNKVGYYYYTEENRKPPMKLQVGYGGTQSGGYGASFNFVSPVAGKVTYNSTLSAFNAKYRLTKNGTCIYPSSGKWENASNGINLSIAVDVTKGDVLALECYSDSSVLTNVDTPPTVIYSSGNTLNSAGDYEYSPLWERPWNGREYSGNFTERLGSVWNFNLLNFKNKAKPSTTKVDTYNSTDKSLTSSKINNSAYIFNDNGLKFEFGSSVDGMGIIFNAPERTNYDFSTALSIANGSGSVYVRILKNNEKIYPVREDWYILTGKAGDSGQIEPIELSAMPGDQIALQIYGEYTDKQNPLCINLGTPVFRKLCNRVFTETGNTTIYQPADYACIKEDISDVIPSISRFMYSFETENDTEIGIKSQLKSTQTLKTDDLDFISFKENYPLLSIKGGNTAKIKFLSPMECSGTAEMAAKLLSGGVQYRIIKDGDVILDWASTLPATMPLDLKLNEEFTVEIKASTDSKVSLESLTLPLQGKHNNNNTEVDDGFYAAFACPFDDNSFKGNYKESDNLFWKFRLYDAVTDTVNIPNKYNSDNSCNLYADYLYNAGYYFKKNNLSADIHAVSGEQTGIALGFTAPRDDVFNFRSGLRITTKDATATLKMRLVQQYSKTGEFKTIWPADGECFKVDAKTDQDITVPYMEFDMDEGDTVYLQVYAEASNKDDLSLNLIFPSMIKDTPYEINHPDISARVYTANLYNPYQGMRAYSSTYIPMENRWNPEFIEVADNGDDYTIFEGDTFINTGNYNQLVYKGISGWLNYTYGGGFSPMALSKDRCIGTNLRFISPVSGNVQINNQPSCSFLNAPATGVVKYRILRKNYKDGTFDTVWPQKDKWELLNKDHALSDCEDLTVKVEIGDQLLIQYVPNATNEDISNLSNTWRPSVSAKNSIIVIDSITEGKLNFSANTSFMSDYQINPYFKVQSTLDIKNPDWTTCTSSAWDYWMNSQYRFLGISSLCRWRLCNYVASQGRPGELDDVDTVPAICFLYTPHQHGYVSMSSTKNVGIFNKTDGYNALVRITSNGKNVYPTEGWLEAPATFKNVNFEVNEGDEIRFEMTVNKRLETNANVFASWDPSFTQNKYSNIYSKSDDIYNLLDSHMLSMFKSFKSSGEFGTDLDKSVQISQNVVKRKAEALIKDENDKLNSTTSSDNTIDDNYDESTDDSLIDQDNDASIVEMNQENPSVKGDYSEWTEKVIKPGGGFKKIIRRYSTNWWFYFIIIGGSVVVAAGIAVLVIILIKRKKLKKIN